MNSTEMGGNNGAMQDGAAAQQVGSQYRYAQAVPPSFAPAYGQQPGSRSLPAGTWPVQASSRVFNAGFFGFVVAGTGALGANLHKVNAGDMTMGEAVGKSLYQGAAGGVATAAAVAAAAGLTAGGTMGLVVGVAAATGVNYLLSRG
ncbi:MAG: hypothetical protein ACOX5Z_09675 [Desulfobulbus sp.]|jgi:hypothetical protein